MKNHLGVRSRLYALLGIFVVTSLLSVFVNMIVVHQFQSVIAYRTDAVEPFITAIGEIKASGHAVPRFTWLGFIKFEQSPQEADEYFRRVDAEAKKILKTITTIEGMSELNVDKAVFENFKSKASQYESYVSDYIREIEDSKKEDVPNIRRKVQEGLPKVAVPFSVAIETFQTEITESTHRTVSELVQKSDKAYAAFLLIVALGVVASIIIGFFIIKGVSRQLIDISLNLGDSSNNLSVATNQISIAANKLAQSTSRQAAAIHETSAAIEQISAMVQSTASNSGTMLHKAQASNDTTNHGSSAVQRLSESIMEIQHANTLLSEKVESSNQRFEEIVKAIQGIEEQTKTINDIVFQTRLLSFNASVEAARAGDSGKGFAVVAEEVGNLAVSSGREAKEISAKINESIISIKDILTKTRTDLSEALSSSQVRIQAGVSAATECAQNLEMIRGAIGSLVELTNSVSRATQEQAQGVTEISKAMQDLNTSVQINSSATDTSRRLAIQLFSEAKTLRDSAGGLRKLIDGKPLVAKFVWKTDFELGVSEMDKQHIKLVDIINAFAVEMDRNPNSSQARSAFDDLASYAKEHFQNEEQYMASIQYDGLPEHKDVHKKLLNQVAEVGNSLGTPAMNPTEVMNFINDWLVGHIMSVDMHYADYSRDRKHDLNHGHSSHPDLN